MNNVLVQQLAQNTLEYACGCSYHTGGKSVYYDHNCARCHRELHESIRYVPTAIKKVNVTSVELTCPECIASIPAPSGSQFWRAEEVPMAGQALKCPHCGNVSKTPRL